MSVQTDRAETDDSPMRRAAGPHVIVFANEKGGTGKSTSAVHVAVALASQGYRVAGIDLDPRQRTFYRYLENRDATAQRRGIELPTPAYEVFTGDTLGELEQMVERMSDGADYLIADTPGRDDRFARHMATLANTLVTPMNDSFVDFDLVGQVDPDTYKVKKLSFYADLIWEARKTRAKSDGVTIDWVLMRNRLQHIEARNMRRVGAALTELAKRVGFRVLPGLGERVVYRELFPSGLTLLDKGMLGEFGVSHIAARQELREMVAGLQLPRPRTESAAAGRDEALAEAV